MRDPRRMGVLATSFPPVAMRGRRSAGRIGSRGLHGHRSPRLFVLTAYDLAIPVDVRDFGDTLPVLRRYVTL